MGYGQTHELEVTVDLALILLQVHPLRLEENPAQPSHVTKEKAED